MVKTFTAKNYKYLLFCLVFAIINVLFVGLDIWSVGYKKALFLLIFVAIYILLCAVGLYLKNKKGFKVHQLFLVFASVLGILLVFATPLGAVPDEMGHFRRAYEIAEGHFVSNHNEQGRGGNYLPKAINDLDIFSNISGTTKGDYTYESLLPLLNNSDNRDEYVFQDFGTTALYSPLAYTPQVIGIEIGRVFNLSIAISMYLARLFNLLFWIVVLYFAIKFIPIGKSVICLLMLSPISLQAAASCQIDAFTNVVIIGMISFVLYEMKKAKLLSHREKIVAIALSVALALSKIVYLPLCFLLVLLPRSCFKSRKNKVVSLIVIFALATILNLAWLAIASKYLVEFQPGVDTPAQVHYIFTNPFRYILVVFRTYAENGLAYLIGSILPNLGWFHILTSQTYAIILAFFALYVYLSEDKAEMKITPPQKLVIFVVTATIIALTSTSLYVQWTALKAPIISGIQGRYFTALLPLGLLLITPLGVKKLKSSTQTDKSLYALSLAAAVELYAITSIVTFYL